MGNSTGRVAGTGTGDQIMTREPVQRVTGVDLPRLPTLLTTTIHDDAPAEGEEEYAYKYVGIQGAPATFFL